MDDEEHMALHPIISQRWGDGPFGNFKTDQAPGPPRSYPTGPSPARYGDGPPAGDHNDRNCGSQPQSFALFHGTSSPGPPRSEPMEDRGARPPPAEEQRRQGEEEEEERRGGDEQDPRPERPAEHEGPGVEVEIGRKLRQIGDQFNRDHAELLQRHQMEGLPAWMRLAAALIGMLFPRNARVLPLRAGQR